MQSRGRCLILTNIKVYSEKETIENGYVIIEDETIRKFGPVEELKKINQDDEVIDFPKGYKLIPGMIDLHIHGVAGADTMDATKEAIETMASTLPKEGTTSFLATTMTQEINKIERALLNVLQYINQENQSGKAEVIGIHLEGPFISPNQAGAQPLHAILEPDVEFFKKWQEMANGHIKLVTLAPEREGGLELAAYLKKTGVVASVGHSDATYHEVVEGIQAGISHATHLFNAMRGLHHREPGVVGAALLHKEIITEIIADGIHVCPEMVQLSFQQKGKDGMILITDAMRAKCLGNGVYSLGGQEVHVRDGKATLQDGTLAGSILKMRDAMNNIMAFTGCSLEDVIHMTAVNPAKQLNMYDKKGSINIGKDADLVILNEKNDIMMTFCKGQLAFGRMGGRKDEGNRG
jgi:N-acetylglucosamine-6-phosphate deacetylase